MNVGWVEFAHCLYLRLRHLRNATNIQFQISSSGSTKKPFPNFVVSSAKNNPILSVMGCSKRTYQQFDEVQSHNDQIIRLLLSWIKTIAFERNIPSQVAVIVKLLDDTFISFFWAAVRFYVLNTFFAPGPTAVRRAATWTSPPVFVDFRRDTVVLPHLLPFAPFLSHIWVHDVQRVRCRKWVKESHRLTPCNVLRFNKTSVHRESCQKHSSELKLPRINYEPLNMYTYATQGSMILIRERTGVLDFFGTYLLLRY